MSQSEKPDAPTSKLHFVEWMRVALIGLVVAHHAGQPYGPTGGSWPVEDPANSFLLLPFFAVNASFFMGLFFFISAYFLGSSYDRKGPWPFLKDRLTRLGVPLVFFVFLVNPFLSLLTGTTEFHYPPLNQLDFGPLWFVAHLLVYAGLYVAWRLLIPGAHGELTLPAPGHKAIAVYVLLLGMVTVFVRMLYPQDTWIRLFGLIPMEPAHLPQYASLFVIGVVAGRSNWFTTLDTGIARAWFYIGVAIFLLLMPLAILDIDWPKGMSLETVWAVAEGFVGIGVMLGLTAWFHKHLNAHGSRLSWLQGQVYGVYLVHVYVVVSLQWLVLDFGWPALVKWLVVSASSLIICFALVGAARKLTWIRAVL